jgi:hypothetical protein
LDDWRAVLLLGPAVGLVVVVVMASVPALRRGVPAVLAGFAAGCVFVVLVFVWLFSNLG